MTGAVQAAGARKMLVPILEKLKGSWSERSLAAVSAPLLSPLPLRQCKAERGGALLLPPAMWHGLLLPKGRAEDFLWLKEVWENPTQPPRAWLPASSSLPVPTHCSRPSLAVLRSPRAAFSNIPFAKRREKAFLIIILGLFFFFLQNMQ